jgi:hypothetical protein
MGRSTAADKRRQDQRNDFIGRVAADLGLLPEVSTVDQVMLAQAADLLLWNPLDRTPRSAERMRFVGWSRTSSTGMAAMGRPLGCRARPQKRPYRPMALPGDSRISGARVVAAGDSP